MTRPGEPGPLYEEVCADLGLEPLEEAGGFFSVIKRYFTGSDAGAVDEIREELARGLASEAEKRELLRFLDNLIEEAKGVVSRGVGGHVLGAAVGAGGVAVASRFVAGRAATAIRVGSIFAPSGPVAVSTALVDHVLLIGGLVASSLVIAGGVVSLVSNLTRLFALQRGTVREYLRILTALRREVESAKVTPVTKS